MKQADDDIRPEDDVGQRVDGPVFDAAIEVMLLAGLDDFSIEKVGRRAKGRPKSHHR